MKPFVSVCLPVYNGQKYLSTAVESILAQSCSEFELLMPDDASSDGSFELITELAGKDRRIKCWRNVRRLGLFANYNQCIRNARGSFIKPMAQDDILDCTIIERALAVLESHGEVSLVSTGRRLIDESGAELQSEIPLTPVDVLGNGGIYCAREVIQKSLNPLRNFIGEPATVMFRASAAGAGFSEVFRQLGDLEYWLRILMVNHSYAYIDERLAAFRVHRESESRRNMEQLTNASEIIRMASSCKDLLKQAELDRITFLEENLRGLAQAARSWYSTGELSETSLEQVTSNTQEETASLRKALLHCLLLLSDSAPIGAQRAQITHNELKIRCAEYRLKLLLNSWTWQLTRPLREVNRLLSGSFQVAQLHQQRDQSDGAEQQHRYLQQLRKQKQAIIHSRSWKLVRGLRLALRRVSSLPSLARTFCSW